MVIYWKLDDSIIIQNKTYTVNASFDVILKVTEVVASDKMTLHQKSITALILLINDDLGELPLKERVNVLNAILERYLETDEQEEVPTDLAGNPLPMVERKNKRLMDIKEDSEMIYAAFMQAYQMDLFEQHGKLHWFKFKALLNNLPSDTHFQEVVGYRAYDSQEAKKSHKTLMRELQKKYALDKE